MKTALYLLIVWNVDLDFSRSITACAAIISQTKAVPGAKQAWGDKTEPGQHQDVGRETAVPLDIERLCTTSQSCLYDMGQRRECATAKEAQKCLRN